MIGLDMRRVAIVRPEEPQRDLWPIRGGWEKVRTLKRGDRVIYRGTLAIVQAIEVYQ